MKAIHPVAWLVWLSAVLVIMTTTRNPLYLLLVLGWVLIVYGAAARASLVDAAERTAQFAQPFHPLRLGALVTLVAALYNFLTVHVGANIVWRLPYAIPLLGGPLTLEGLLYGATTGLMLTGLFSAFGVIHHALSVRSLVRLMPRAYYPVAVVVSIAVTFVPSTLYQLRQIREAQAVRGHKVTHLRDLLPLWMPLLAGGMERALQLAEAMTARGFARTSADSLADRLAGRAPHNRHAAFLTPAQIQGGLMFTLVIFVLGWLLRLVWGWRLVGMAMMLGALGVAWILLWLAGRQHPHTVYRPEPWTRASLLVLLGALLAALLFVLPLPGLARDTIFYLPYPRLTWPGVHWLIGAGTLGLLTPVIFINKASAS